MFIIVPGNYLIIVVFCFSFNMMSFVIKVKLYFGLFAADKLDSVKLEDFPFWNRIIIRLPWFIVS